MGKLLYLVHRLPYPPNKGDKVRSYHLLKHLTQSHRVFLGTFIDDPADEAYLDTVRALCPDLFVARLHPRSAKLRSLTGLLTQQALGLRYYQNAGLQAWVKQILAEHNIDAVVIFSSVMAQYVDASFTVPMLVDFVDVDSAKWTQYAPDHRWPLSWLFRREGERLLAYERSVAQRAQRSFFVTDNEAALFRQLSPESATTVEAISNGVDANFFAPDLNRASPFGDTLDQPAQIPLVFTQKHQNKHPAFLDQPAQIPLVFTGAMDYWPNIDAVTWFVADMLPSLRQQWPQLCFYIVGRSPPPTVKALAGPGVVVTGTVPDVRPYLQHAAVVVAPLRVARGIQNKILEAMAMARPVVASESCAQAIDAEPEAELLAATSPADFITQINALLASPERSARVGAAGRQRVLGDYSWSAHLSKIDTHLNLKARP